MATPWDLETNVDKLIDGARAILAVLTLHYPHEVALKQRQKLMTLDLVLLEFLQDGRDEVDDQLVGVMLPTVVERMDFSGEGSQELSWVQYFL